MEYLFGDRRNEICCVLEDNVPGGNKVKPRIHKILPYPLLLSKTNTAEKHVEEEKTPTSLEEYVKQDKVKNDEEVLYITIPKSTECRDPGRVTMSGDIVGVHIEKDLLDRLKQQFNSPGARQTQNCNSTDNQGVTV